jgi:Fungal specific transcription factor domain
VGEHFKYPLTREEEKAAVLQTLQQLNIPCDDINNPIYKRDHAAELIDHWYEASYSWIGAPELQRIMQEHGIRLGLEAPFMLNAVLAFSATHLKILYPVEQRFQIAASLHFGHALKGYSFQLSEAGVKNADHLFGTCMVMNMLSFFNTSQVAVVKGPKSSALDLGWVRIMRGMSVLSRHENLAVHRENSIWGPVFRRCQTLDSSSIDALNNPAASIVDPDCIQNLNKLFDYDEWGIMREAPYSLPLQQLSLLARTHANHNKTGGFALLIGKLPQSFVQLLDNLDHRALLILSYWCALSMDIDQWWIIQPAREQCQKICEYLRNDLKIRHLLDFPIQKCNLELEW